MNRRRYAEYKDSGSEWFGLVPNHWQISRIKNVACLQLSNVDKHSVEGQKSVSLCNYMDAYRNEKITGGLSFMQATASDEQIRRLSVKRGDVLLTKDSETTDDIGVPALVTEEVSRLVCGYHLALLRPREALIDGTFLLRWLQSSVTKARFAVDAVGMTRYGLGKQEISGAPVLVPPIAEQQAIAAFLDREAAKIDALIAKQQRLVELLQEKRKASISQAVTIGLDPHVQTKDSGDERLGRIPAHWVSSKVKHYCDFLDGARVPLNAEERGIRQGDYPYYGASGIIDHIDDFIFSEDLVLVAEDGANLLNRSTPLAFIARGNYWVNNHAHILRPQDGLLRYWAERIEVIDVTPVVSGSAQPKLTAEALASLPIAVPPTMRERLAIQEFIQEFTPRIDSLIEKSQRAIDLLEERRASLISAAVTGKIDLRAAVGGAV